MGNTYRIVALEWLESVYSCYWRRVADPLQRLPVGNNPHIVHRIDCVQKFDKSLFVMWLSEPRGVIEQAKWCSGQRKLFEYYFLS